MQTNPNHRWAKGRARVGEQFEKSPLKGRKNTFHCISMPLSGFKIENKEKITHIQASDVVVRFQFATADQQEQSELLQSIVHAGFPLLEFSTESRSLEDVFLHITTGAVQ